MKIREIMSRDVVTTTPSESAQIAFEQMCARSIHHMVVVQDGEIVGVVSDQDLGGRRANTSRRMGRAVGELMCRDVLSASPSATVRQAATLMRKRSIASLPVVERGKLVGIVTISDLLARLAEIDA